jgi:pimeloyl-ACP methyl ester carboxylesterase
MGVQFGFKSRNGNNSAGCVRIRRLRPGPLTSWSGVITRLQRDGYTVLAPPNPLRSLSGNAAYLREFLATVASPIVLVGHSYGGAVITNAATGNSSVKALV